MSDTKKEFAEHYDTYFQGWTNWLTEAQTDMEFYLDAQFSRQEHAWAEDQGRTLLVFNKLKRQIRLLHGYEIRNRHILKIGPIGREDDKACRQHTGLTMQAMTAFEGYDTLSEAFKWGPLISGSNLFELWRDRDGNIRFNRRGYNTFMLDPMLKYTDLSDCSSILTGDWLYADKIKELLPEGADKIDKIPVIGSIGRWQNLPGKPMAGVSEDCRLFEQWWQLKKDYIPMVIDRITGAQLTYDDYVRRIMRGDERRAKWFLAKAKLPNGLPMLSKFSKPIPKVTLKILVDSEPVWEGDNPLGLDEYNFVWVAGEWVPECDRSELKLQGFARTLREPQKARNKRLNQIIDIIESAIQQGLILRQGAFVDKEQVYKSGQGLRLWVKKDSGPLSESYAELAGSTIQPGLFQVLEVLDKDEEEAGGLNQSIMGADDKDIPGILHKYRTGAALTAQQGFFSGYRRAKRQIGRKLVKLQQMYEPGKVFRILNEYPAKTFYQPDMDKYDCEPVEGLLTDSQRNLWYHELKYLRQTYPDAAQVIPLSMLIEAAPVQYKDELMQAIKKAEQQQQQAIQQQLGDKARMDRLLEAQATEDLSQAREARTGAALDMARTAAEINKMGVEPFLDVLKEVIKLQQANIKRKVKK